MICWALKSGMIIMPWSIRRIRSEAIDSLIIRSGRTWKEMKAGGWQVVKVSIEEIRKSEGR